MTIGKINEKCIWNMLYHIYKYVMCAEFTCVYVYMYMYICTCICIYMYILAGEGYNVCIYIYLHIPSAINNSGGKMSNQIEGKEGDR